MENISAISNAIMALMSIATMLALIIQLRGANNINKNNYLLTIDKYFAESRDMKNIYSILSDYNAYPILLLMT